MSRITRGDGNCFQHQQRKDRSRLSLTRISWIYQRFQRPTLYRQWEQQIERKTGSHNPDFVSFSDISRFARVPSDSIYDFGRSVIILASSVTPSMRVRPFILFTGEWSAFLKSTPSAIRLWSALTDHQSEQHWLRNFHLLIYFLFVHFNMPRWKSIPKYVTTKSKTCKTFLEPHLGE